MKRPRLAALRLEAEDVLTMHLFAHQLNGLLQSVLLQETQRASASVGGEQAEEIRLLHMNQLADSIYQTTGSLIGRYWSVVGGPAESTLSDLDPFRLGFQILGGLWPDVERLEEWRIGDPINRSVEPLDPLHHFRQLRGAAPIALFRDHEDDAPPSRRPAFEHQ